MKSLFEIAMKRFESDDKCTLFIAPLILVKHGGIVCNCGSWYKEEGAGPLLTEVMNLFQPDLVLVIHDEQVYVTASFMCSLERNQRAISLVYD